MQQQVLRTLVRDGGYGLYHRYIENNSSLNDPEFIKHNNNIIGDICFKFKQEKKGLLDRLLTKTQKERDEMSSKQEYVYILVPVYKSLRSNLNGNEFDKILNSQRNTNNSNIIDFTNFIDYNKPYISYSFENSIEKSHVIVMMTSQIHVSYPRMQDLLSIKGFATPTNVKLNSSGFYNENMDSPEMSCRPIYEEGSLIVEKKSQLADDGKISTFEEQLELLGRTTFGKLILGLLGVLFGYLIFYSCY